MFEPKKILFTTDFSPQAAAALPHAAEMARRYSTETIVLHVGMQDRDDPAGMHELFDDEEHYRSHLEAHLKDILDQLGPGVKVRTVVLRASSVAGALLDYAEEEAVDLIVLGTHGRSGISRFFLGSVAEKVIRHARCPVLAVGPDRAGYRSHPGYEKILVGFDFSEYSQNAAAAALELARRFGARVQVLHVVERFINPVFSDVYKQLLAQELPGLLERTRESLKDSLGKETLAEVDVEVRSVDEKAHREIARFARDGGVDLIVVGTHGLSGWERLLMGSTTERLLRCAPCPILVFASPEPD